MVADFLREAGTLQVAHDQVTSFLLAENYQVTSFLLVENDQVVSDREDHVRVASILREEKDKVISILPADHDRACDRPCYLHDSGLLVVRQEGAPGES